MLPSKADPRWTKLVTGELPYDFKTVAASMMLSRLKRSIQSDASPGNVSACVAEFMAFAEKYESLLAADFAVIFK
jgi:hypothetical protein